MESATANRGFRLKQDGPVTAATVLILSSLSMMNKQAFIRNLLIRAALIVLPFMLLEGGMRVLEWGLRSLAAPPTGQETLFEGNKLWQHEFFSRFRGVHRSDPLLIWAFKPNVRQPLFRTNSAGLLGPEIAREKPPGVYRILLLGDSTPVGLGLQRRREAFGEQLIALLRLRHPDLTFELINAAVSGYTSQQGLLFLQHHGLPYAPDLVLTYFGNNDASVSGFISDRELVRRNARVVGVIDLLRRLATYRLMEKLVLPLKKRLAGGAEREPVVRVPPEEYGHNLEQIIRLAREGGAVVAMVDVPVPLEWPAGLQFKQFANLRNLQGELVMADRTQQQLKRKIAYAIDWQKFAAMHGQITRYSLSVFKSAYEDQGDIGENIASYRETLLEDPHDAVSQNNLGVLYGKQGKYDEALDCLRRAVAEEPEYAVFHYNLGMTLKQAGRLAEARAALVTARDLDYQSLRIKGPYVAQLRELSARYAVPLVEADAAFERAGRERLFVDHCHPTIEGHRIIAEQITELFEGGGPITPAGRR